MRHITFVLIALIALGCFTSKHTTKIPDQLNGYWVPVTQEMGGSTLPASVVAKQELVLADSTYKVTAESTDKGIVRYNGNKMDIYGKDGPNAGKHFTAIYKYENDQLTICYNLAGDSYPDSYDTKGKPLFFMSVFKRETAR